MDLQKEEVDKALGIQLKQSKGKKAAEGKAVDPPPPPPQAAAAEEPAQDAAPPPEISLKKARVRHKYLEQSL